MSSRTGYFAGAEIAVLTASKASIEHRRDRRGAAVRWLRERPERFLATVQIGITVVGAAAAAFGGASIAHDLAPRLEGMFGDSAHEVAMVLACTARPRRILQPEPVPAC